MHMLRWTRIFVALIAVLAVGVVLIRLGATLRQDEAVFGWSNALVWMEVGTTFTPRFRSQARLDDPRPNVWVVSGEIALPDSDDGETWDRYVAVVRQVCNARLEKKCWALESLELGGEGPTASVARVSRGGTVMQSHFAEDTAPVAETTETDGRDISVAGASTRTNKVAIGSKPSVPEDNRLVATEANPIVEEAAQAYGGVTIVIDDNNTVVLEAPEAANKASSQGGFRVQLGAFRSSENAPKHWQTLQSRHSDVLGEVGHQIRRVDAGGRGIFYYLYAGPLPTASLANSLCRSLVQQKVDCLAVKP